MSKQNRGIGIVGCRFSR